MSTTIEQLAELLTPQIPITIDLWGPKEAAAYFKVSTRQFKERISCRPQFPRPIRLPTDKGAGRGHPRWKAIEVIKWAESQSE